VRSLSGRRDGRHSSTRLGCAGSPTWQCSFAIRTTKRRISASTPRRLDRGVAYVHLRATNCRCQRSDVSGVTMVAISRNSRRPSRYARSASRRRSSSVRRRRRPPSCRRKRRFSSIR
jgi:hypothetical protein